LKARSIVKERRKGQQERDKNGEKQCFGFGYIESGSSILA
jgi:hypothetical protein